MLMWCRYDGGHDPSPWSSNFGLQPHAFVSQYMWVLMPIKHTFLRPVSLSHRGILHVFSSCQVRNRIWKLYNELSWCYLSIIQECQIQNWLGPSYCLSVSEVPMKRTSLITNGWSVAFRNIVDSASKDRSLMLFQQSCPKRDGPSIHPLKSTPPIGRLQQAEPLAKIAQLK